MNTKQIQESIHIQAPAEKVWEVITNEQHNKIWLVEFGQGNIAETDWQEGSKALFMDGTGNGLAGVIEVSQPFEKIVITYRGIITEGKEDYESEFAKGMDGYQEIYALQEEGSGVRMSISCDMDVEYFDDMSAAWRKALEQIKALAES